MVVGDARRLGLQAAAEGAVEAASDAKAAPPAGTQTALPLCQTGLLFSSEDVREGPCFVIVSAVSWQRVRVSATRRPAAAA